MARHQDLPVARAEGVVGICGVGLRRSTASGQHRVRAPRAGGAYVARRADGGPGGLSPQTSTGWVWSRSIRCPVAGTFVGRWRRSHRPALVDCSSFFAAVQTSGVTAVVRSHTCGWVLVRSRVKSGSVGRGARVISLSRLSSLGRPLTTGRAGLLAFRRAPMWRWRHVDLRCRFRVRLGSDRWLRVNRRVGG
jgi:hypothetical protein